MRMKRYIILLFLFVLVLTACSSSPSSTEGNEDVVATNVAVTTNVVVTTSVTVASDVTAAPGTPPTTAVAQPSPTTPVLEELPDPTATESPTAVVPTPSPETPLVIAGRTEDGAFFLGNPEADVTMIDFSDFL